MTNENLNVTIISIDKVPVMLTPLDVSNGKETLVHVAITMDQDGVDLEDLDFVTTKRQIVKIKNNSVLLKQFALAEFDVPKATEDFVESKSVKSTKKRAFRQEMLLNFTDTGAEHAPFKVPKGRWTTQENFEQNILPTLPEYVSEIE